MPVSLRRNFLWTLAGTVTFAMCQWATIIVITKVGSTKLAGDWTLALAITGPIFVFAQLKLRQVQATDAKQENRWGEFVALRMLAMVAAVLTTSTVVLVAYRDDTALVILLVGLAKVLDAASDLVYGREQQQEMMRPIALSQIVRGLTAFALSTVALVVSGSVAWAACGTASGYAAWFAWDLVRVRRLLKGEPIGPRWARAPLVRLFRLVLPLGFVTAIGSLQVNIPRYFLEGYTSREDLGAFGTLAYLLVFGNMVVSAVANAAVPRMARLASDQDWSAFRSLLAKLLMIGAALGVAAVAGSVLVGREVLTFLYSPEVATHADVLVWMAVTSGLLWSYVFLGTSLDAMRRFRVQPWIHGTSTLVIMGASALLVPRYHMLGAAWAMLVGYGVESVLYCVAVAVPLRRMQGPST
ncbi:MAG: oligosaccharide flippase family protein [Kofleriaceae bacterium]|nr:oligosaccharide flippase family protein [Kofleriaceae bacterium]